MDDSKPGYSLQTFVLNKKARHAAEAYVLGLFQLYPTIYYHKATRCLETMAAQMLIRIFRLVQDGQTAATGLPTNHPYTLFAQSPDDLDRMLALDDTVIIGALPMLMSASDSEIKHYANQLHGRIVYKCYDISRAFVKEVLGASSLDAEEVKQNKLKASWVTLKHDIKERMKAAGICHSHVLIDSGDRSPYKQLDHNRRTSPLNQIHVHNNDGQCVDINSESDIVKAVQTFRFYRIYADKKDNNSLKFVEQYIKEKNYV
jgi:HD superfamily phosphohydrolase